ncbi:unnamed protein product [Prorocentrum cordatum]|uniref:Uncharacterized protein n=1 Tax=Prorocentrum cordatum TaxID=2364126 RepID=A0ABN9URH4_9DINO|nr:unnamed protein product [Polarella glacialis]|mmetsp:Transcript_106730/g.278648  ORF Transcript_106730/g.278648 Transcript_106730/m.278648 type:complete len:233 (+) Transcript_106730:73-771(+)
MPTARALFFPILFQLATAARPSKSAALLEGQVGANGKIMEGRQGAKSVAKLNTSSADVDGVCCLCSVFASYLGDGKIYTPEVRDKTYGARGAPKTVIQDGTLSVWVGAQTVPLFCLVEVEAKYDLGPMGAWGRKCADYCPEKGDVKYRYVIGYHADDEKGVHHVKGACEGSRDSRLFYQHAVEKYDIGSTSDSRTVGVGHVLDSSSAFMRRYGLQNVPYRLPKCSTIERKLW